MEYIKKLEKLFELEIAEYKKNCDENNEVYFFEDEDDPDNPDLSWIELCEPFTVIVTGEFMRRIRELQKTQKSIEAKHLALYASEQNMFVQCYPPHMQHNFIRRRAKYWREAFIAVGALT